MSALSRNSDKKKGYGIFCRNPVEDIFLHNSAVFDDFFHPFGGEFLNALLIGIVDINISETRAEAVVPFQIVHKTPMEITFDRYAVADCFGDISEVQA